jgi:hypothetical protein
MANQCEMRQDDETACGDDATWVVSVGTRKTDEQLVCDTHLSDTCLAFDRAEGRDHVILRVQSL